MTDKIEPDNTEIQDDGQELLSPVEVNGEEVDYLAPNRTVFSGVRSKSVYAGMWGPIEMVTVGIASFLLLSVGIFYLFFVIPAQNELAEGRRQRDELDRELQSARGKWGDIQNTETQVAKLQTSAEDFESRALKDESIGKTAVYQRLNVLINAYGLRNSSGPDYVPLEASNTNKSRPQQGSTSQGGRDKFKSLFPGIYITTTVEGTYSNLRRFIRDIESSQEFVAITSVELEPSDEEGAKAETEVVQVADQTGKKTAQRFKKGRYRGSLVSLRIEMAAYFRRPGVQRLIAPVPGVPETQIGTSN